MQYSTHKIFKTLQKELQFLIQAIFIAYKLIALGTKFEDKMITFEEQTLSFYFHYNDFYRIGIKCETMTECEYNEKIEAETIFDLNLKKL
jgi:hypothetical protein